MEASGALFPRGRNSVKCSRPHNKSKIKAIDHLVLSVIERSVEFYVRVLNMEALTFRNGRRAVRCDPQKINFQILGQEQRNRACVGSGDLCLLTDWTPEQVVTDLDGNLIEMSSYPAV